jgi:hypothetical protein
MQNVILMYSREYFSPFVKLTCDILNVKGIIWIDDYTKHYEVDGTSYVTTNIRNMQKIIVQSGNETVRIISFDIYLIPVVACLRLIKEKFKDAKRPYEFCFIQHGTFSDLSVAKRSGYKIKWVLRSARSLATFIKTVPLFEIPKVVKICIRSFYLSSYECRNELTEFIPVFQHGVFWNRADIDLLGENIISKFETILETRPPDDERVSFQFSNSAAPVYISQPLYEDDLVEKAVFVDFVSRIKNEYPLLKVVLHPRSNRNIFEEFTGNELIELEKTDNIITTSLVLGHFSSLLLVVPKDIPMQTFGLDNRDVENSIKKFNDAYTTEDINILSCAFSELSMLLTDD